MAKTTQNVTFASGAAISIADFVAKTFFHTSLTPDALAVVPVVIGAVPHIYTSIEEFVKSQQAKKVAKTAAQKAAAEEAAQKAKDDFAASITGAVTVALADKLVPESVVPVAQAVAVAVATAVHDPAAASSTVGIAAP